MEHTLSLNAAIGSILVTPEKTAQLEELCWHPHPKFTGVALKHLLLGADTGERFSLHLVRVAAGCTIGDHTHPTQHELHQVVQGQGTCQVGEQVVAYAPGSYNFIPQEAHHTVQAGAEDLYLIATFVPPLI